MNANIQLQQEDYHCFSTTSSTRFAEVRIPIPCATPTIIFLHTARTANFLGRRAVLVMTSTCLSFSVSVQS